MRDKMLMSITYSELKKAIETLELAIAAGFTHSDATLTPAELKDRCELSLKFDKVLHKAHPTDPNLDWGVGDFYKYDKVVNGKFVDK